MVGSPCHKSFKAQILMTSPTVTTCHLEACTNHRTHILPSCIDKNSRLSYQVHVTSCSSYIVSCCRTQSKIAYTRRENSPHRHQSYPWLCFCIQVGIPEIWVNKQMSPWGSSTITCISILGWQAFCSKFLRHKLYMWPKFRSQCEFMKHISILQIVHAM